MKQSIKKILMTFFIYDQNYDLRSKIHCSTVLFICIDKNFRFRSPLNLRKHLLGVNRTTTNTLVRGELGRYSLNVNISFGIKSFFDHIINSNKDDLVYLACVQTLLIPVQTGSLLEENLSEKESVESARRLCILGVSNK